MKITQICGPMEGKDVVNTADALKKKKEKQAQAKEAKIEKKRERKGDVLQMQRKSVCGNSKCNAIGLKECPKCHDVLHSVCTVVKPVARLMGYTHK